MEKVSGILVMTLLGIFNVDNSLSSYTDNRKNDFIVLGEGDTFDIGGSFGAPERKFSINFRKAKTKLYSSLHYNGDNSNLFVNGKKIFKFKANNKNVNFSNQFYLGSISLRVEAEKVSLKRLIFQLIMMLLIKLTY